MVLYYGYLFMTKFENLLTKYDYRIPPELIAQNPAKPRDSAKLLVYNPANKKIGYDTFKNIAQYLPPKAVLVFNQTKVIPARLTVYKPTGGKVDLLYISADNKLIKFLANKKILVGTKISINKKLWMEVVAHHQQFYFLQPSFPINRLQQILNKHGKTPLPPYIKHSSLSENQKREQYQTVFAKTGFSVAAPTASLHFTKKLMSHLRKQGMAIQFVTLHVNMGTFAPLTADQLQNNQLHHESYNISEKTASFLNQAKKSGRPIIAVGTTVVRTLETASHHQQLTNLIGGTQLFIRPPYKFEFTDGLITNFHVRKSTLLMLVASSIGRKKLLAIYQEAIKNQFRFFSFGDGMLILPKKQSP